VVVFNWCDVCERFLVRPFPVFLCVYELMLPLFV
jgi:hypothetical protein